MVKMEAKETEPTSRTGKNSNKGFTLLELALVLFILGLMSIIAVPRVHILLTGENIERAARNLVSVFRYARGLSAGEGVRHFIHIDLENDRYWLSRERQTQRNSSEQEEVVERRRLPDSVTFEDVETLGKGLVSQGEIVIQFWSNGFVETAQIHLRSANNRQLTLTVNPITGMTQIEEGYVRQKTS
jgi:general secretion pathway protein H